MTLFKYLIFSIGILLVQMSVAPPTVAQVAKPKQADVLDELLVKNDFAIEEREVVKKLRSSFSADYTQIEFSKVQELLRKKYKLNIELDRSASDDALRANTQISFSKKKVSLQQGLLLMLGQHNATFMVDGGVVRVISKDEAYDERFFSTRVYNVRRLLKSLGDKAAEKKLIDLVKGEVGGDSRVAAVSMISGLLVVKTTQENLMSVEKLLSKLQVASEGSGSTSSSR